MDPVNYSLDENIIVNSIDVSIYLIRERIVELENYARDQLYSSQLQDKIIPEERL